MGKIMKVKPKQLPSKIGVQSISNEAVNTSQTIDIQQTNAKLSKTQKSIGKITFQKTSTTKKAIKKKDKRSKKHKNFISKIHLIKDQEKESILKKKREKTAITGDLKPLKDALPSLNDLFIFKPSEIKANLAEFKSIKTITESKRDRNMKKKRELIDRYRSFTNLIGDPDYKKNARETIANHIKFTRDLSG